LFSVTENYPQLKADANFNSLQNTLKELETEIASSRKYYNGCVKMFNNKIEMFPSNLIANHYHFEKKVLFEIVDEVERQAPQVKF
jgi:LemA protein